MEIKKLLYSMGEVSEMFDVKPSLIRYWESQFDVLRPKKNKKGNRLFTPEDVQMLKLIYHLVKEQGMTLEGARRSLKQNRGSVVRDSELLERLQRVRALLVEVREDLKAGDGDLLIGDGSPAEPAETAAPAVPDPESESAEVEEEELSEADEAASEQPRTERKRRRRKPSDVQEKELFAFYEQSLFRSYED